MTKRKRLALNKETVSNLSRLALEHVYAGNDVNVVITGQLSVCKLPCPTYLPCTRTCAAVATGPGIDNDDVGTSTCPDTF